MFNFFKKTNENKLKEGENVIYFFDKKRVKSIINIKNGKRDGICKFYNQVSGKIKYIINYKEGEYHGVHEEYNISSGNLRRKANYKNGQQVNEVVSYFENGKEFRISNIVNDIVFSTKEFFPNGTLRFIKNDNKYEFYDSENQISLEAYMKISNYKVPKYGDPFTKNFISYVNPYGKWKVYKASKLMLELNFEIFDDVNSNYFVEVKNFNIKSKPIQMEFKFNTESLVMFDSKFIDAREDGGSDIRYANNGIMGPPGANRDKIVANKSIDIDDLIIFENDNLYNIDDAMPPVIKPEATGSSIFKRDLSGLEAYFKEMTNMEQIFNELTGAIRNGYSVKQYLKEANLLNDKEIRSIAAKGFSDVSSFLNDMLELNENPELRKDYNACIEAVKLLEQ